MNEDSVTKGAWSRLKRMMSGSNDVPLLFVIAKRPYMKKKLIAALITVTAMLILTVISCRKALSGQAHLSNAEIIGFDMTKCVCCGGYEITIDNVANPDRHPYFLALTLPPGFDLGSNPTYPVAVKIDWQISTNSCFGNIINVSKIVTR